MLLGFKRIETTTPAFRSGLVALAKRLQADPNWIAAIMARESGFNPSALNPFTHAAGLIQFMPATAHALGTSTAALLAMTAEEQLPFVESFYHSWSGRLHSAGDTYMATFMPAFVGKPLNTILFAAPSVGYQQNRGMDRASKGTITVGDVHALINGTIAEARRHPAIDSGPEPRNGHGPLPFLALLLFGAVFQWGIKKRYHQ